MFCHFILDSVNVRNFEHKLLNRVYLIFHMTSTSGTRVSERLQTKRRRRIQICSPQPLNKPTPIKKYGNHDWRFRFRRDRWIANAFSMEELLHNLKN